MSWLFSQALVAEYLEDQSSDGEPSAPLSVMPTEHRFWHRDKTTEYSQLSRYGLTCRVLTVDRGEALLTSYLAASRARTSASPEKELASPERAVAYGDTWHGSLARYDPDTRSWRTVQRSLFADLELSLETFPRSGMTVNGLLWELPTLAPSMAGTASGLWQTPVADDAIERKRGKFNSRGEPKLSAQVKMFPTVTVHGNYNRKGASKKSGNGLETFVKLHPTPVASDYKSGKVSEATAAKNSRPLREEVGGNLNPLWTEWLMGWPLGWSELEPSATDKYRNVERLPGDC